MSTIIDGRLFVKISELEEGSNFKSTDEFVFVQDGTTLKINGQVITDSVVELGNLASKGYVDAIVAGAPDLLNTLDELAAALGDDENFAANITAMINEKVSPSNFETYFDSVLAARNTYHLSEGSNLYFTTERARNAVFDSDDLINFKNGGQVGNAQLVHEGIGSFIQGMDIYSPASHEWVQLNYDDRNYVWVANDFVGIDVSNETGYVTWRFTGDGVMKLPAGGDIVDVNGNSVLGGGGSTVTNINDLADVTITNPTAGQVLKYNGTAWINDTDSSGGGDGTVGNDPTFNSVTVTDLNVQNVEFTGTGAVTITSGNDLNFVAAGQVTINGETFISLEDLKSVVALSTDFADFKSRIAGI